MSKEQYLHAENLNKEDAKTVVWDPFLTEYMVLSTPLALRCRSCGSAHECQDKIMHGPLLPHRARNSSVSGPPVLHSVSN